MEDDETRSNTGEVIFAAKDTLQQISSSHQRLLVEAGEDGNTGDSSAAAAPTSSDVPEGSKTKRLRNLPITNLLSRQVLSLVPNIKIPEKLLGHMKKWKALVGSADLRPIFGCSFCGPSINDKIFDLNLLEGIEDVCPFCSMLKEEGWKQQPVSRNVKYVDPSGASCYGVASFLRVSTSIVQQKIYSTRSEDMNNMVWLVYPVDAYPDVDHGQDVKPSLSNPTKKDVTKNKSTSTKNKQPSLSTKAVTDSDDFHGLSIKSLAASLSKERQLPKRDPSITKRQLTQYSRRNLYTSHPDPRPIASCSWCGVDKDMEKLCSICDTLREHGWSTHLTSDQIFNDHNDEKYRCVKNFLLASTDYIAKAMNAMPEEDRLRLIGQYDDFNKDFNEQTDSHTASEKRQRNNHAATNDYETYTPKRPKGTTIQLPSISQLLTQDNGLEGVLKADLHSIYNLHFGSNANIAAKILTTLGKGDIPPDINTEVPFLRSSQTIQKYSNGSDTHPSRFVGVFRVVGEESSYAVAIPEFRVDCPTPPKAATVNNGQLCLLRVGIKEEQTAGQLFAYMYRALYGTKALSDALKDNQQDLTSQVSNGELKVEEPVCP